MQKESKKEYKYKDRVKLEEVSESSEVQKIHCPDCSAIVPVDNLYVESKVAKCVSCNGMFSISEQINDIVSAKASAQEVLKPEGIEMFTFKGELDITVAQKWQELEGFLVIFFPMFIVFGGILLSVFILPLALRPAVLITYFLVSSFAYFRYFSIRKKHKTNIHINKQYLHIEHRPKKFKKDQIYKVEDIDQIYIKAGLDGLGGKGGSVHMVINTPGGQKHIPLLGLMNSITKAKYVEQEIEKHLGITDRRVPDEYA